MKRQWLAPEVVQTSATDCGPAALKCVLEGLGVPVRYDRLREACATDVDGTSFDTLEALLEGFGVETDKALVPVEDLLFRGAEQLPAIVATRLTNGFAHFVVLWRRVGNFVLVMDPAHGRRWLSVDAFLRETMVHKLFLDSKHWSAWVRHRESFHTVLDARLRAIGIADRAPFLEVLDPAANEPHRQLGALDAAARMTAFLVDVRALASGPEAEGFFRNLYEKGAREPERDERYIPSMYWSGVPIADDPTQVVLRGVPVIRVVNADRARAFAEALGHDQPPPEAAPLKAVFGRAPSALLALWALVPAPLRRTALALPVLVGVAAVGELFIALALRQLLSAHVYLRIVYQQVGAVAVLALLWLTLWALEGLITAASLRLGRHLELRFRVAWLSKLPLLPDSYFRTRAGSDLADRCHGIRELRTLPDLATRFLHSGLSFACVLAGLVWLQPDRLLSVALLALVGVAVPLLVQRPVGEIDMRARTHAGGLMRFYLDALLGVVPIRALHAKSAISNEHERLLVRWGQAQGTFARYSVFTQLGLALMGVALVAVMLVPYTNEEAPLASMLLVTYWALSLPVLGNELAVLTANALSARNLLWRLAEPLSVPVPPALPERSLEPGDRPRALSLELGGVSVSTARSHQLLRDVTLSIAAGEHVAIVGASGAGKSSLLALLLGWLHPSQGAFTIGGQPPTGAHLKHTAWVDPTVRLWNQSLHDNLVYGSEGALEAPLNSLIEGAELVDVLERLPNGIRTSLGEGGNLLSGGEGQRVRVGRALGKPDAQLVLLDEPFRGLDRARRAKLLALTRKQWAHATLLCVTHDVAETREFARVIVVEGGRILEDGSPDDLAARPTRYRELLEKERQLEQALWAAPGWRHLLLDGGALDER